MKPTLRWRLGLPYVLLLTVVMVGVSAFLITSIRRAFIANLESSLTAQARLLAADLAPQFAGQPPAAQLNDLAHRGAAVLGARVTVIRADGLVLGDSEADPATMDNHLLRPEVHQASLGQVGSSIRRSDTLQTDMLYLAVPITSGDQVVGILRLARPLDQVEASLAAILRPVELVTALALVLCGVLSVFLTEYSVRPIRRLTQVTRQLASGTYDSHPLPASGDEIGELNQAFNQMAHELRDQITALQAERGKLAAVLARMSDGVLIAGPSGQVELINPAAERMFAVDARASLGQSLVEVIRHHQLVELWQRCQESGKQQVTTIDVSAEKLFLQAVATPLEQVLPGSTLLLFQDLTRLRRLETVRQDFISNVSHELRTPLASLKALTETLQEGALEDPPAARRFLERMELEIDTLTQMVRELLELSRIESGRAPLERRPLPPGALLAPAVERMRLQAERAGLALRLECPSDLPPVSADPERVEQVLVNLLHNAIKFTPPGGEIAVQAAPGDGQVVFSVRDTGVGIAAKDLERIFERFYKADRARSGGGTGLGLSIARHLIEAHGGRIWAESRPTQGSTFFFTLPAA